MKISNKWQIGKVKCIWKLRAQTSEGARTKNILNFLFQLTNISTNKLCYVTFCTNRQLIILNFSDQKSDNLIYVPIEKTTPTIWHAWFKIIWWFKNWKSVLVQNSPNSAKCKYLMIDQTNVVNVSRVWRTNENLDRWRVIERWKSKSQFKKSTGLVAIEWYVNLINWR